MQTNEIVMAALSFALALLSLILAIRHFMQRGFLLNNAYIFASKAEREKMDKKPHYVQTAIALSFIFAIFFVLGMGIVLRSGAMLSLIVPLCIIVIVYSIISSVKEIRKK